MAHLGMLETILPGHRIVLMVGTDGTVEVTDTPPQTWEEARTRKAIITCQVVKVCIIKCRRTEED